MKIFQTSVKSKRSFTVLATAIILLAVPAGASAQGTVRDHRTPAKVIDHRKYVRDHRAPMVPAKGGGVTVTDRERKPNKDAFWP
jgi:hypothetical protein